MTVIVKAIFLIPFLNLLSAWDFRWTKKQKQKKNKKTQAVKFLELFFRNNFYIFNFSKCVRDESCGRDFPPFSQKGLVLEAQTEFCVYRWNFCNKLNSSNISKSHIDR